MPATLKKSSEPPGKEDMKVEGVPVGKRKGIRVQKGRGEENRE